MGWKICYCEMIIKTEGIVINYIKYKESSIIINILTKQASINDEAPEAYRGLDRFEARKQIVADIEALGLLEKIEPHKLKVPRGDRRGVISEPYLTPQWYVAVQSLADPAIKAVENG